jgi:hypothetical protein
MQKELVQGVPFWRDKSNNLYSFEPYKKNLLTLGTFNPTTDTYILKDNWKNLYESRLNDYRKNLNKRERKENKESKN